MNQSNIIFAFLFAAFVIFITQRGELSKYLGFLLATPTGAAPTGSTASAPVTPTPQSQKQSSLQNFNTAVNVVQDIAMFV